MQAVQFNATVQSVVFRAQDSGFTVLRAKDNAHGEVTFCGVFPPLSEGQILEGNGEWVNHPKFGRQIKPKKFELQQPQNKEGILKYLQSGLVEGVGPKMAQRLYKKFGDDVLRVMREEPQKLSSVEGVGKKRVEALVSSAKKSVNIERIMTWLMGNDISTGLAFRIHKQYGDKAIERLKANPWALSDEMFGVGFKTADAIAKGMGLGGDHPSRIQAGLKFVLSECVKNGNTGLYEQDLIQKSGELLAVSSAELLEHGIHMMEINNELIRSERGKKPDFIQSPRLFNMEKSIAGRIREINSAAPSWDVKKAVSSIPQAEKDLEITLSEDQREAVRTVLSKKVSLLIGKPGCGKTTVLNVILRCIQLAEQGIEIALGAPTGKAAQRMSEATKRRACTMHRMLKWGSGGPAHDKDNPLEADYFAFDEVSMVDTMLAFFTFRAIPDHAGVVMVGDQFQLPSVGAGSILADLRDSGEIAVAELTHIHRQAAGSAIVTNAHAINEGRLMDIASGADCEFIKADNSIEIQKAVGQLIRGKLAQQGYGEEDVQVLTAGHRGASGTKEMNDYMQALLNANPARKIKAGFREFAVGDRILVTRNNYDLEVFNGQTGNIEDILDDGHIVCDIEGEIISFPRDSHNDLNHAYCMTVHKSQGSQFPIAIILVDTAHWTILERNWLYTAITRAQKHCIVISVPKAVGTAVRKVASRKRLTRLKDHFSN